MPDESTDIFDRIMELETMRPIRPIYRKYREGLLYLFFGGLTFFMSIVVFALLNMAFGINPLVSNAVSWIVGVTFSFFTTRRWVFRAEAEGLSEILHQMGEFGAARLATLGLQELLLYIFITQIGFESMTVKVLTEIINIILNYLASKFIIFRKK